MKRLFYYYLTFIFLSYYLFSTDYVESDNSLKYNHLDTNLLKTQIIDKFDSILSNKYLSGIKYGVSVYSMNNRKYLYRKNSRLNVTPASTTKLFTSFVALNLMGDDYEVPTQVFTDGKIISDTVLKGNVYLVGNGDLMLSIRDLEILAEQISRMGIKRIDGKIYADGSFYDGMTDRFKYSGDADEVQAVPPVSALSVEKNIITVIVNAGRTPGSLVNVQVVPSSEAIIKNVSAIVKSPAKKIIPKGKKKKSKKLKANIENEFDNYYGDMRLETVARTAKAPFFIKNSTNSEGKQVVSVGGTFAPNSTYSYQYYNLNPELSTAGCFKQRLNASGIKVNGAVEKKAMYEDDSTKKYQLIAEFRRPLIDLMFPVNKDSDNHFAENLFKMIGAFAGNHKNNSLETKMLTERYLNQYHIPCDNCKLNDGSGLSRRNSVTSEAMVNLLVKSQFQDFGDGLETTLSIAGIDGTLRNRLKGTKAENNLRGKTGTLRNVSALAGYINTLDGDKLVFAYIFNGPSPGLYKALENDLNFILSEFSYNK